jgi:uncharacterized membrane protein YraQ (UPF0718 family)
MIDTIFLNPEVTMNRAIFALILAATVGFGMPALADDTMPQQSTADQSTADRSVQKTDRRQFMKDCMANAKAANNGASEQDMKKACKEQWKATMGNSQQPVTPAH